MLNPSAGIVTFHATDGFVGDSNQFADVNGDGLADIMIGTPNQVSLQEGGKASLFIVFGTPDPLPSSIDLEGSLGAFAIGSVGGSTPEIAYTVTSGDVNGDGRADVVANGLGGAGADGSLPFAGAGYVIDGRQLTRRVFGELPEVTISPPSGAIAAPFRLTIYVSKGDGISLRDTANFTVRINDQYVGPSVIIQALAAGAATLREDATSATLTFPALAFPPAPATAPLQLHIAIAGGNQTVTYTSAD